MAAGFRGQLFQVLATCIYPAPCLYTKKNPNLTLSMTEQGKELAESTQICAILLISNLRNLQYLASLSIPMPQFEVLATSVYLAP